MQFIVARYNENVEWTKQFKNVIIYNKGQKLSDDYNQVFLNNVGREGHTYYQFIYDNYDNLDNLDDYLVFLQGYPFDHSPNLINNLNNFINSEKNLDFKFLSEWIIGCNLNYCDFHPGLPIKSVYKQLFNNNIENMNFVFGAGAQFIVAKKKILEKPKDFYLKIIKMLEYDNCPIEGYVIERLHQVIFS